MRVFTHHHHDIRSDAWRHCECNAGIGASHFLRTRTKAERTEAQKELKSVVFALQFFNGFPGSLQPDFFIFFDQPVCYPFFQPVMQWYQ